MDFNDERIHNIKIQYYKNFDKLNFIRSNFRLNDYLTDYLNPLSATTNWYS